MSFESKFIQLLNEEAVVCSDDMGQSIVYIDDLKEMMDRFYIVPKSCGDTLVDSFCSNERMIMKARLLQCVRDAQDTVIGEE